MSLSLRSVPIPRWCVIGLIGMAFLVGCAHSLTIHTNKPAQPLGHGHLSLSTGASISLLPGEIIPIQEYYYPPTPAQTFGGHGVSGLIFNPTRTCTSCRADNPSVARLRYVPAPNCYLPPDFSGDNPKPCGRDPSEKFIEGVVPGKTTLETTVEENGESLKASTEIVVSNNPTRLAFIAPRWGDKLRQGDKNVISWRCGGCSPGDRLNVDIFNGDKSTGGTIAYHQPPSGSFVWDAKRCAARIPHRHRGATSYHPDTTMPSWRYRRAGVSSYIISLS